MALCPVSSGSFHNISYDNVCPSLRSLIILIEVEDESQKMQMLNAKQYIPGACYACGAMPSVTGVPVLWCAGCQLVAYCNKDCQRANRKAHKIICKALPVEMGKNIIVRKTESICRPAVELEMKTKIMSRKITESEKNEYRSLYNNFYRALKDTCDSLIGNVVSPKKDYRVAMRNIMFAPHVCNVCCEARPEKLFDCRCCSVSYCNVSHRLMDKNHFSKDCDVLYLRAMGNWYLAQHRKLIIPDGLLNEVDLYDGLKFEKVSKLSKFSSEKWLEAIVHLINNSLTFPLTILYALKNLKLGEQRKCLSEITSLTIHIVNGRPMLDPRMWEFMLHQLPDLKTLNLTFINRYICLSNPYNTNLPLESCSDCQQKQRVINYNIVRIHYHEYFSSNDYVEPDVVVVFDTRMELMIGERCTGEDIEQAERFASQGNMTSSQHTVVILTDELEENLEDSVKSFHDARPVEVLLPIQENPAARLCITGFVKNKILNPWKYLCCLQGNH